jgi:hypothetical protein
MAKPVVKITQEMIDAVFSDPKYRGRFTNPKKAKEVCEMRLAGAIYTDIAKRVEKSHYYCIQTVHKVERLYTVFIEG